MKYSTNTLNELMGAPLKLEHKYAEIEHLCIDSRTLSFPESTLFIAIKTATGDGHKYVQELNKKGVHNFLIQDYKDEWNDLDANFWRVNNTVAALQTLASYHRQQISVPIIGITGSNGKTTVKEWLYTLLQNDYRITRSPKSYNSQVGVPLSIWQLNEETELGIFEAGISQVGEMKHLAQIIQPTLGIFTNLGSAHQGGFASTQEKLEEKLLLFQSAQTLIFHKKYPIEKLAPKIIPGVQLVSWEFQDENAVINVTSCQTQDQKTDISLTYQGNAYSYTIPFVDEASIENSINAIATCLFLGKTELNTLSLEPIGMRLEIKQGLHNCILVNDAYNSDLNALNIALNLLLAQAEGKFKERTVILSDVQQSGMEQDQLYAAIASLIKEKGITQFIGIGSDIKQYWPLFPINSRFYENTSAFLAAQPNFENQAILIKGARSFCFERITAHLELKRHQTVMEINLNALVHNFKTLRSFLQPTTKTVAMIKANAYGCGAIEVAQALQHHHCDYFGVAVADEGAELRKAGIRTPIIVMDPEPGSFDFLIQYHLEPEIYSFSLLEKFIAYADKAGVTQHPIHIKIDTGMHRLGFTPEEIPALIPYLLHTNVIHVESAFSHLAAAEDPQMDDFTQLQISRFMQATDALRKALPYSFIRHILNTSGIQRIAKDHQLEMVRMGIGLYGVGLNESIDIQNIATLKTVILQIKHLAKGETVGYNRRGILKRDSVVAAIPIGYADGLNRAFGNGNGYALVNGQKAPFLGNICMDVCMIDVTDIPGVQEGDTVTIFGDDLTISELAEKTHTIPYEILTSVSNRVKRIYFQE